MSEKNEYGLKPLEDEGFKFTLDAASDVIYEQTGKRIDPNNLAPELAYYDYRFYGMYEQDVEQGWNCPEGRISLKPDEIKLPVVVYTERNCLAVVNGKARQAIYVDDYEAEGIREFIEYSCDAYTRDIAVKRDKLFCYIYIFQWPTKAEAEQGIKARKRCIKGFFTFENKDTEYKHFNSVISQDQILAASLRGLEREQARLQSMLRKEKKPATCKQPRASRAPRQSARQEPYQVPVRSRAERLAARSMRGVQPQLDVDPDVDTYDQDLNDILGGKYDFGRRNKGNVYRFKKMLKYINKLIK